MEICDKLRYSSKCFIRFGNAEVKTFKRTHSSVANTTQVMKSIVEHINDDDHKKNNALVLALNKSDQKEFIELCMKDDAALESALIEIISIDDTNSFQDVITSDISQMALSKLLYCDRDAGRVSLLHFSAAKDAPNICKVLLDQGFSPNQWNHENNETPMLAAARTGSHKCLAVLFDAGGNLCYQKDDCLICVLIAATKTNQKLVVRHIIEKYGSLLREISYIMALHIAVECEFDDIARILINCGTPVNTFLDEATMTSPLHVAAENNNVLIAKNLVEVGADSNLQNFNGQSPLHLAVWEGNLEILKVLIYHGADVNKQDKEGRSPIHYLINSKETNKHETLEFLVSSQADINMADKNGTTPLHLASLNRCVYIINFLINSGAELCAVNKAGYTAIHFIFKYCPDSMHTLLERLDSGINIDSYSNHSEFSHQIRLNFRLLKPNTFICHDGEVRLFKELLKFSDESGNNNVLKKFLLHPLSESYLRLKWNQIKWLYYVFILLSHFVFSSTYTAYSILIFNDLCPVPLNSTSVYVTCNVNNVENRCTNSMCATTAYICGLLLVCMIIPYIFKEITHFVHLKMMYFHYRRYEHWLNLLIIASVPLITYNVYIRKDENIINLHKFQYNVAISGTFITWFMLMLLLSKLPKYGLFIEMLKTVSVTVFHFFVAYSPLLLGFGFSFYILFPWYQTFNSNISAMFLKVLVMMIGEIDFEGLYENVGEVSSQSTSYSLHTPFSYTAYFLIGAFVIFISIIIMNLLFGLAVSDIQKLMQTAQLHQLIQHVQLISYMENILCCPILKRFPKLITNRLQDAVRGEGRLYKHVTILNAFDPTDRSLPATLKEKLVHKSNICNEQDIKFENITENFEKLTKQVATMQKVISAFKYQATSHQTLSLSSSSNGSIFGTTIKRRRSIH